MPSSTIGTILSAGVQGISDYLSTLYPVILPVAAGIAILFGIWYWIRGSSRRRI